MDLLSRPCWLALGTDVWPVLWVKALTPFANYSRDVLKLRENAVILHGQPVKALFLCLLSPVRNFLAAGLFLWNHSEAERLLLAPSTSTPASSEPVSLHILGHTLS